jgi:Tfp pilus assembly protein FimT
MVIVLAIAGLLAGLASIQFYAQRSHFRLNAAVRALVSDLRWARQLAVAERSPVRVVLDLEGEAYRIERASLPELPVGGVRRLNEALGGSSRIDLVDSSGGPVIAFQPNGTTSDWTTVLLKNGEGEERRITVILTGRVRVL